MLASYNTSFFFFFEETSLAIILSNFTCICASNYCDMLGYININDKCVCLYFNYFWPLSRFNYE